MDIACAIFVRAPGSQNGKTRLSRDIGTAKAAAAYRLSLMCVRDLAHDLQGRGVSTIWAVDNPESVDDEFWLDTNIETIYSGDGNLGDCLANVSEQLHMRAKRSILLGSDSPQLTIKDFEQVLEEDAPPLIAGPANDGGFYMFSSNRLIEARVWQQVTYSTQTTLEQLVAAVAEPVKLLKMRPDFDEIVSLEQVVADMPEDMSEAQREFARFACEIQEEALPCSAGSARNIL